MSSQEIEKTTLEIFQKMRQKPGATYDPRHFLQYLVDPPATIKSTFVNTRKYYKFLEAIELQFGICFRVSDQDRSYSVDQLVKIIQERIGNTRGNKMVLKQRLTVKDNYFYINAFLTVPLLLVLFFFRIHVVSAVALILWGIAMGWIIRSRIEGHLHNKRLFKLIFTDRQGDNL